MDPASLALAILPLALTAIKGYSILHKRMKIFCHYSREIRRLRKHLNRQRQFFHNELHLMIQIALKDDHTVQDMMENPAHWKWECHDLERSLRSLLGQNYETCLEVIEEISSTVRELQDEMESFNEVESLRQDGELLKDAVRRLRSSLKIAWDKSKFESSYTDLRNYNDDLRRLRNQASEIRDLKMPAREIRKQSSLEYGSYGFIRSASKALHGAFENTWSDGPIGLRHSVKMFIDAKVEEQVCMDVAVLCHGHNPAALDLLRPSLRVIQVRSQTMEWVDSRPQSPPSSDPDDGHRKRQRVRFADDCTASKSSEVVAQLPTPKGSESQSTMCENLTGTDICLALAEERSRLFATSVPRYLGYMENSFPESFRHSIYHEAKNKGLKPQKLALMSQMFGRSMESAMTVVDQLRLARNMVVAVLKFHSTPWLRQYFVADDFHFFEVDTDLSSSLRTLHFSVDHNSKGCTRLSESYMQGIDIPDTSQDLIEEVENASIQYGIRNMTLWSLGAILLQIGRWSKINSPDDVFTVRKLSSQVPPLGPRYQQLTKKCLDCDFGYGDDLSKPRLQQAVYENLVCELTEMIEGLSICS
ncbi:hypothetical protein PFICI_06701 [Pestalotiopsis fici W106-1]|uniref:Prion-inhibition and propagation HeLo domain-containing protein n=1 Tax=Pestalotiopsis fici (strain W106-1 / CGMCC3.15140) TaxID=1229662 RepID=W3X6N1_PESFW|nr:uncharacterized protein PFICI_06701 [Pestalotiopsis fici W106-1]ETS81699.1 hypothetical protein PFICI_06701 [Pestalotiopsis fici W106-1]